MMSWFPSRASRLSQSRVEGPKSKVQEVGGAGGGEGDGSVVGWVPSRASRLSLTRVPSSKSQVQEVGGAEDEKWDGSVAGWCPSRASPPASRVCRDRPLPRERGVSESGGDGA